MVNHEPSSVRVKLIATQWPLETQLRPQACCTKSRPMKVLALVRHGKSLALSSKVPFYFFIFYILKYLFIYLFWLRRVLVTALRSLLQHAGYLVAARGIFLVAACGLLSCGMQAS